MTEARQKAEERLAKELGYWAFGRVSIDPDYRQMWNALVSRELEREKYRQRESELRDALIWMSGSLDFAYGGIAHEGWKRIQHLAHALPEAPKEGL